MTSKNLLKLQKLTSKIKEFKAKTVFDIVLYGSYIRGKQGIGDVDIAVILNENSNLDYKLTLAESLKSELDFLPKEADIKVIDLNDLIDPSFIARQAILTEGYSILKKKYLHEIFGFSVSIVFKYDISKLNASKKKMFYYALKGRRDSKGLLYSLGAKQVSNCMVAVPIAHSEEFKELFNRNKVPYESSYALSFIR